VSESYTKPHRYRTDQEADYDAAYGDGYPETFPKSATVGTRVYGRLGTDAERENFGAGTIEEISEDRREALVVFSNRQKRLMDASDCAIEDAP